MYPAKSGASVEINDSRPKQEVPGSIFAQPWWLDAVAPGFWNEAIIQRDGQCIARMPYVTQRRHGSLRITMPPLTQTLGPWLHYSSEKYASRLSEEKDLISQLISQLPRFAKFNQRFHHRITNWLPFYWHGFSQTTRYTYVIPTLENLDEIWNGMASNIRREIRKAEKSVGVRNDRGLGAFLNLNEMVFRRQKIEIPYSRAVAERIDAACGARTCREIFFAEDATGRLHAALYLVWDSEAAYYLMGGGDPDLRTSGATSLLFWRAINYAATVTRSFDFEGSMIEPIERFFRAFGARQVPYFQITKVNSSLLKMADAIRSSIALRRGGK